LRQIKLIQRIAAISLVHARARQGPFSLLRCIKVRAGNEFMRAGTMQVRMITKAARARRWVKSG